MTALIFALFWLALTVGWIMNVVQVIGMALADHPATTLFIVKIVGIITGPLGGVLGWVSYFN